MKETIRTALIIIISFTVFILSVTLGYHIIEGWTFSEAFYMTVITITTVGFGEVHPLTRMGMLYTAAVVLVGFSSVALLGTRFAKQLIEGELSRVIGRRTMKSKIEKLRGHFIVCGHGRIGGTICNELTELNIPFVIIEENESMSRALEEKEEYIVYGNATSDDVLREAGVERAEGIISVVTNDADNLFIALSARELNPRIFIVARGEDPDAEPKILRAGADVVISPYMLGGKQIAVLVEKHLNEKNQTEALGCGSYAQGFSLKAYSVRVPGDKRKRNKLTLGEVKTVGDAIRATEALSAVAVRMENGDTINFPKDDLKLNADESIILLFKQAEPV